MAEKIKKNPLIYEIPVEIFVEEDLEKESVSEIQIEVVEVPVEMLIKN